MHKMTSLLINLFEYCIEYSFNASLVIAIGISKKLMLTIGAAPNHLHKFMLILPYKRNKWNGQNNCAYGKALNTLVRQLCVSQPSLSLSASVCLGDEKLHLPCSIKIIKSIQMQKKIISYQNFGLSSNSLSGLCLHASITRPIYPFDWFRLTQFEGGSLKLSTFSCKL